MQIRHVHTHTMAAAIAFLAMIACSSSNNAASDSAASGTAPGTVAAVPGAAPGPDSATLPSATTSSGGETAMTDGNIVAKSLSGDSAEVAIGRYMEANTKSSAVRSYAALLVSDHGKGMRKVTDVESKQSITPQPPSNDTTAQETAHVLDHLRSLSGADRDTAFVNHEIADHQADIADAKQMAASAQNPQVKAMVQNEIPELQKHLDKAQALAGQLGKK